MSETRLLKNAAIATMAPGDSGGHGTPYGLIANGAVAIHGGRITFAGPEAEAPDADSVLDCGGRLITPGLIDCHTHLIFGGNRANEFEARLNGKSYEEIARADGGIISTVKATRAASEDELVEAALPRLDALIAEGVTTIEIKSGYGLDTQSELKMLRAAKRLEDARAIRVKKTFLGAHAVPPEFDGRPDDYIDHICTEMLPAAKAENLVDAVDGFCEGIGFTPDQITRVFEAAKSLAIPVKLHAEQLSDLGGAKLAARYGALSADHLEYLAPEDAPVMAASGTVATLLPGAFYYLRESKLPPVGALRKAGVPIAIATDCNPGSSPMTSLLLAMNMGCTFFSLTPEEALAGVTRNAAKALGLEDERGVIETGKTADLAIWDLAHPSELSYFIGYNPLYKRVFEGTL